MRCRTVLNNVRRIAKLALESCLAIGLIVLCAFPAKAFSVLTTMADEPPVLIDGRLTEGVWQRAPVHATFAQLQPTAGANYSDAVRTQVQVVADGKALIFGIRAWGEEPPRVVLSRRDAVQRDQDMIGVWIDTGGRGESAMFLKASLAGVVTDGLYRAADDDEDTGPDFPVEVRTDLLHDGYSMEIRWPLSALRYPYQAARPWRIVVARAVPDAGDLLLVSGRADAEALSFLHSSKPLNGLEPTLSLHRDRQEGDATVEWTGRFVRNGEHQAFRGGAGVEGWWRPRADWLVNATLNPDFAQVDIDEPQTNGNRAVALAVPEKRRYFLESADVLGLPLPGFYSRTVADPRWGLRATWRGVGVDATVLVSEDRAGTVVTRGRPWRTDALTLDAPSTSEVFRGRWQPSQVAPENTTDSDQDLADGDHALTFGALLSRRDLGSGRHGQIAGIDGLWKGGSDGRHWQAQWNLMASQNTLAADADGEVLRQAGPSRRDRSGWAKLLYSDDRWFNSAEVTVVGPEFVNLLGFVDQAGLWRASGEVNRRLGEVSLPGGGLLYRTEWHFGVSEARTLRDPVREEPGNEVIRRELRTGFWLSTVRRTAAWLHAGLDRQRAYSGGRLHDTPALHGGVETTPFSWLARLTAEGSVGRQIDTDFDRVGNGGWWSVRSSSRWALPAGRSLEFDPVFTGTRIRGEGQFPSLNETGVRLLGVLHLTAQESMRVIVQSERATRSAVGAELAQTERSLHRSVMWKKRYSSRYQLAFGAQWDTRTEKPSSREVFLKLEAALENGS